MSFMVGLILCFSPLLINDIIFLHFQKKMTFLLIICSWQALQRPHAADIGKPGGWTDQVFVPVQPLVCLVPFTWWMWIMDAEVDVFGLELLPSCQNLVFEPLVLTT